MNGQVTFGVNMETKIEYGIRRGNEDGGGVRRGIHKQGSWQVIC